MTHIPDIAVFGETTYRNQLRKFGIKVDDRRRHMYLIGKTGMGKSTILENMIIDDIRAGRGVAVVDPHGDLAEKVMQFIPPERINDVIYFNPADIEYPIAFNVIEQVEPHLRHLVASGLIGVFQKLWADSWGPRLEYILRNTILAILDYPGSTLLGVTRMFADKKFRKRVIDRIQDPVVRSFWVNEFASYADKFASEAVSPIQNKVGQFLSSSLMRNIVGQVKSSINIREVMDGQKILIMNLSKGRIGEDNSALLGAMMITKIQLAAMSRVDIPEHERKDFYLYIDEFQNFTTDSFTNILSEARKYHLNLIMAHQYVEQLGEKVEAAVFGNVGTLVIFRIGAADAEKLVKEFEPVFTEEDMVNLPKYEFYIKLMIDGVTSTPFSARGLRPLTEAEKTGNLDKVIRVSRERYAQQRDVVEEKIRRWHESDEEEYEKEYSDTSIQNVTGPVAVTQLENMVEPRQPQPAFQTLPASQVPSAQSAPAPVPSQPSVTSPATSVTQPAQNGQPPRSQAPAQSAPAPERPRFERPRNNDNNKNDAICSRCSKKTKVAFVPDGLRPVFCKECLQFLKEEKTGDVDARKRQKAAELASLGLTPDSIGKPPLPQNNRQNSAPKVPAAPAAPNRPKFVKDFTD
ncbi:type IV secretion system DNA-binding domain-containing protein [Candidatus Falkowbacteria bacterium]|nr:type IV secretion system DNA-binding domain-containing protein [Candidatus Falkowbacteria bacterium]